MHGLIEQTCAWFETESLNFAQGFLLGF
jgi:hypothetical protein